MKRNYPDSKSDLFAAFIERCIQLSASGGAAALITMQSWMFLSSYEKLRHTLLAHQRIASMLHLGTRAFDSIGGEVVSLTAFTLVSSPAATRDGGATEASVFVRLVEGQSESDKVSRLSAALSRRTRTSDYFVVSTDSLHAVPGSPIAYWLSEKMRLTFVRCRPLSELSEPKQGIATADNQRFLRYWWEPGLESVNLKPRGEAAAAASGSRWFPMHKGGPFRKWYGNYDWTINWFDDGCEIKNFRDASGRQLSRPQNLENNFKPGITWSAVTAGGFTARLGPSGYISNAKGPMLYPESNRRLALLGCLNSAAVQTYLNVLSPTLDYSQGPLGKVPTPDLTGLAEGIVESLVECSKRDWDSFETSSEFDDNPLVFLTR